MTTVCWRRKHLDFRWAAKRKSTASPDYKERVVANLAVASDRNDNSVLEEGTIPTSGLQNGQSTASPDDEETVMAVNYEKYG
jgi:exo-beta-1,3-glucanase (GH17 family)